MQRHHTPDGVLQIVDGKTWRIDGLVNDPAIGWRCPTEKCNAYCCQNGSIWPDEKGPCEFLCADLLCAIHKRGGVGAKPFGCVEFPRSNEDIEKMGGCPLKLVPHGD